MATYHSGNGGKVTVGATDLNILTWQRTPANRKADVTSSASGGWQETMNVLKGWTGTFKAIFDSTALPTAAGLTQGASVTLKLYLGDSIKLVTGNAVVDGVAYSVDNQNGVVTYDVNWTSTGVWTEAI